MWHANQTVDASSILVELVYELLDAHDDTARLVDDRADDEHWAVHLEYLQRLQRVGREAIAYAAER